MKRGYTVLEALISVAMLGAMFVVLMLIYINCASVWAKGEAHSDMAQNLQVFSRNLALDIERSSYDGLSLGPGMVALLSPADEHGRTEVDPATGSLLWRRYRVYYLDPGKGELLRCQVKLPETSPVRLFPVPIEAYDDGGGPKPLRDYCQAGQVLARLVRDFQIRRQGNRMLVFEVTTEKARRGRTRPETITRKVWARVHN